MVGGLTASGNHALRRQFERTYTFSESLIVLEYNHIFEIF